MESSTTEKANKMKQTLFIVNVRDTKMKTLYQVKFYADNHTHALKIARGQYGAANLLGTPYPA
jgi:hypothetical protein